MPVDRLEVNVLHHFALNLLEISSGASPKSNLNLASVHIAPSLNDTLGPLANHPASDDFATSILYISPVLL